MAEWSKAHGSGYLILQFPCLARGVGSNPTLVRNLFVSTFSYKVVRIVSVIWHWNEVFILIPLSISGLSRVRRARLILYSASRMQKWQLSNSIVARWPSGLRRTVQVTWSSNFRVSQGAWVRIPPLSAIFFIFCLEILWSCVFVHSTGR